jgi:hypothetical protein
VVHGVVDPHGRLHNLLHNRTTKRESHQKQNSKIRTMPAMKILSPSKERGEPRLLRVAAKKNLIMSSIAMRRPTPKPGNDERRVKRLLGRNPGGDPQYETTWTTLLRTRMSTLRNIRP